MSLLACFDIRKDILTDVYLNKVSADLEDENLKVAIIEFMAACMVAQPGLTETLVNIRRPSNRKNFLPVKKCEGKEEGGALNFITYKLKIVTEVSTKDFFFFLSEDFYFELINVTLK